LLSPRGHPVLGKNSSQSWSCPIVSPQKERHENTKESESIFHEECWKSRNRPRISHRSHSLTTTHPTPFSSWELVETAAQAGESIRLFLVFPEQEMVHPSRLLSAVSPFCRLPTRKRVVTKKIKCVRARACSDCWLVPRGAVHPQYNVNCQDFKFQPVRRACNLIVPNTK